MGSDKTILSEAGVQLDQPSHIPVTYLDRLGKVRIEIFPETCTSDDIMKAVNFLLKLESKAQS